MDKLKICPCGFQPKGEDVSWDTEGPWVIVFSDECNCTWTLNFEFLPDDDDGEIAGMVGGEPASTQQMANDIWNKTERQTTGTVITEDESTRPPDLKVVVMKHKLYDRIDGEVTYKWTQPQIVSGHRLYVGEIWWSIEGMFEPPETHS